MTVLSKPSSLTVRSKPQKAKSSLLSILKKCFLCTWGTKPDKLPDHPEPPPSDIEDDDISVISLSDARHMVLVKRSDSVDIPARHESSEKSDSSFGENIMQSHTKWLPTFSSYIYKCTIALHHAV